MRTSAALEVIAYPKTLLLRCRLKVQLSKNLSPRSLDPKIQSRPMGKLPLCPAPINQGKPSAKIRRKSILKRSGTGKTLLRPQGTMSLRVRRSGTIEATKSAIIVKKRAILLGTARNFQKTSVGLGNLRASDWY